MKTVKLWAIRIGVVLVFSIAIFMGFRAADLANKAEAAAENCNEFYENSVRLVRKLAGLEKRYAYVYAEIQSFAVAAIANNMTYENCKKRNR